MSGKFDIVDATVQALTEHVDWGYYNKKEFEDIDKKYLPAEGEGETLASQIVTAINKLIYKWYNDGDVFDNVHSGLSGWANDLSSYANWLYKYCEEAKPILYNIYGMGDESDYETLLQELADACLNEEFLKEFEKPKQGSIYNCEGPFEFSEFDDEEEDYYEDEDDEDDEDEETSNSYTAISYYDDKLRGVEDETSSSDWSVITDFAHDKLMGGSYVKITNTTTGKEKVISPDTYQDEFDDEFVVGIGELDESVGDKSQEETLDEAINRAYEEELSAINTYDLVLNKIENEESNEKLIEMINEIKKDEEDHKSLLKHYIETGEALTDDELEELKNSEESNEDEDDEDGLEESKHIEAI